MVKNPSSIKNKAKRQAVFQKYKAQKKSTKKALKRERLKEAEELGADAPPKQVRSLAECSMPPYYRSSFYLLYRARSLELLRTRVFPTRRPSLRGTARCSATRRTTSSPSTTLTRRYIVFFSSYAQLVLTWHNQ
jgi:hypothetical protein